MLRDMKHPGHHHEIESALLEIAGSAKAKGRRYSEEQKALQKSLWARSGIGSSPTV